MITGVIFASSYASTRCDARKWDECVKGELLHTSGQEMADRVLKKSPNVAFFDPHNHM